MEEVKVWWQSKTILGAIVTVASLVGYLLGLGDVISGEEVNRIVDYILLVTGSGGLLTTIYGRFTAKTKVVMTTTPKE